MKSTPRPKPGRAKDVSDAADESLLTQIADGKQDALSKLYDRYQGLMYGMATRITGDSALAQDVVQEAFLGIWRNAARYTSSRASPRTWILSITHHRAVDVLRRRRPTTGIPDSETIQPSALVGPDVWPEVSARLDADTVRSALAVLPDGQRQAIELAYFGGLTQQEIAVRTAAPLGTVKSRVRLGLLQMRRTLNGGELAGPEATMDSDAETRRRGPGGDS